MKALFFCSIVLLAVLVLCEVLSKYDYEKEYLSFWNLADKSSTIEQKGEYIFEFSKRLEESNMRGTYNAVFLETMDNSFEQNLKALHSLKQRLQEIKTMNPSSFEYQTAIQQITAQEQGEANAMLHVFEGCYRKANWSPLWGWAGLITWLSAIGLFIVSGLSYLRRFKTVWDILN